MNGLKINDQAYFSFLSFFFYHFNLFQQLINKLEKLLKILKNSIVNIIMKNQENKVQIETLNRQIKLTEAQKYLQECIDKPYKKRNAVTNKKNWQQILAIVLFIIQVTFHSVFVAPYIYQINTEVLNFFFILNYFVMCAVIGHYFYIATSDPVDSLVVNAIQRDTVQRNSKQQAVFCIMCQKTVKKTSKHCYECGRCTQQYDHHCKCLNNCIGLSNYQQFIRLLLFYQLFNLMTSLQAIWVITKGQNINKGGNIFLIILNMLNFILVLLLLVFHCYLNCYVKKPTYQYFKDIQKRKYSIGQHVDYKNYVGEILGMARRRNLFAMENNNKIEKQNVDGKDNKRKK